MYKRTDLDLRIAVHNLYSIFQAAVRDKIYPYNPSENFQKEMSVSVRQLLKRLGKEEE